MIVLSKEDYSKFLIGYDYQYLIDFIERYKIKVIIRYFKGLWTVLLYDGGELWEDFEVYEVYKGDDLVTVLHDAIEKVIDF